MEFYAVGANLSIMTGTELKGTERMAFGDDVTVGKDCQIIIAHERMEPGPMIIIGRGTRINHRAVIGAVNEIVIGEYVLTAPGIYFADASHDYTHVGVPIMMQGVQRSPGRLEVCSHSWIGINAALIGNIRVGKGSVIGSNSVVNRSVPDYCVAVGQPARVVRAYDSKVKEWIRIVDENHLQTVLDRREPIPERTLPFSPRFDIFRAPRITIT